jgi:CO dehydrogenase/acetyl-CoA synthase epsilon subunit
MTALSGNAKRALSVLPAARRLIALARRLTLIVGGPAMHGAQEVASYFLKLADNADIARS